MRLDLSSSHKSLTILGSNVLWRSSNSISTKYYKITTNWDTKTYCGVILHWDYKIKKRIHPSNSK